MQNVLRHWGTPKQSGQCSRGQLVEHSVWHRHTALNWRAAASHGASSACMKALCSAQHKGEVKPAGIHALIFLHWCRCRTCGVTPSSAVCVNCFKVSGTCHKVFMLCKFSYSCLQHIIVDLSGAATAPVQGIEFSIGCSRREVDLCSFDWAVVPVPQVVHTSESIVLPVP